MFNFKIKKVDIDIVLSLYQKTSGYPVRWLEETKAYV